MANTGPWAHVGAALAGLAISAACTPTPTESPRPSAAPSPSPVADPRDGGDLAPKGVDGSTDAAHAEAPPDAGIWPPLPGESRRYVFRELLVGVLPSPSRRVTWQLVLAGKRVIVRREAEVSVSSFRRIDGTTHAGSGWRGSTRSMWEGERDPGVVHLGKIALTRTFGPTRAPADVPMAELPGKLELSCKQETLRVRPSHATLTPGIKRNDDTMTRPTWTPSTTEPLPSAWVCTVVQDVPQDVLLWFTKALAFAPMRKSIQPSGGVEWAFANDDMVLQDGGYRYVPQASLPDWARSETGSDAGTE